MTFFCFKTNERQVETASFRDLTINNFDSSYREYCFSNFKNMFQRNNSNNEINKHHMKLWQEYSSESSHICGTYKENCLYFLFPVKVPIINHQERVVRIRDLLIDAMKWSLDTRKYCAELRSLEIFNVLWSKILWHCTELTSRTLLFVDLHIFCHFYTSVTFRTISDRKHCSIYEIIVEKLRFNEKLLNVSQADMSVCSNTDSAGSKLYLNLIEKLRNGSADAVDGEIVYDLKQKQKSADNTGIQLNHTEITLLECYLLKKSFNKDDLLEAFLKSGRDTAAKSISDLKLVILTHNEKITSIYTRQIDQGEVLIVRLVKKIRSITNWLFKNEVCLADIKPGGKFALDVVFEGFSCGFIKNVGHRLFYLEPSDDFNIIPHYSNYNNHIELGLFLCPVTERKYQCQQVEEDTKIAEVRKLLSYLVYSEILNPIDLDTFDADTNCGQIIGFVPLLRIA